MDTIRQTYTLKGIYPDGTDFLVKVICHSLMDSFILAQGARKVTTVRSISVMDSEGYELAKF